MSPSPASPGAFGFLALLVGIFGGTGGAAAKPPVAPRVAETTLHDAIEGAWTRLPQRNTLAAQQNTAAARYLSGSALVPNAPTASGSYVDDRQIGSHYNYVTSQIGVSTPLWLPGEGTATQNLARAESTAVEAQAELAHLALAAQVVQRAVDAIDARNARDIAARRLATNQALAKDLDHRFQVGESSQSDALAADGEAATAAVALAQADAQLGSAQIALAELTGSLALPVLSAPLMPARAATGADHPQIVAAVRQSETARAQERLVYLQDRDDPEFGVQGINEKQPGTRWDTRVGLTLRFHFATEARNAPRRAAAVEAVTRADVQLELTRRQIAAEIARATLLVTVTERASAAAERGAAEWSKRRGQTERAWRLGEMPLIELVRANAAAYEAEAASVKARTGRTAAMIRLAIAEGAIP